MREYFRFLDDPRHFQIITLSSLLGLLLFWSDFAPSLFVFVLTVVSACLTQFAFVRFYKVKNLDFKSPLITSLSLTLLLKASALWIFPLAAFCAMASKFLVRFDAKHLFNPANFAIVSFLLLFPDMVWVSPGQWGSAIWLGFALVCLAVLVLSRARRADISLFFLGAWASLIFGRALWLGDPLDIPVHNMQSGALLIFAFFMISDPKTTPDSRVGRLIFAVMSAMIGFGLQYGFQVREGIFYGLFLTCLFTPFVDRFFKAQRYQWGTA